MGTGDRIKQPADDKSVLLKSLRQQQSQIKEGSLDWHELQAKINQVIADKFLQSLYR